MRPRSPVVDIADNMEMIHNQTLDQRGNRRNKAFRPSDPYDSHYNFIIIGFFVIDLCFFCNQFFNDIGKIFRQGLTNFGTGIFAGRPFADLDQTVQVYFVPILHIILYFFHDRHFFFRVINERGQRPFFLCAQCIAEHLVNLAAHRTRAVF